MRLRIFWLFAGLLFGGCASWKTWCAADPKCAAAHEIEKTCHDTCRAMFAHETDFFSVVDHGNVCTCRPADGARELLFATGGQGSGAL